MDMRKPTAAELDLYPHVDFTSGAESLPEVMDNEIFFDAQESIGHGLPHTSGGEISAHTLKANAEKKIDFTPRGFLGKEPDLEALRKFFN